MRFKGWMSKGMFTRNSKAAVKSRRARDAVNRTIYHSLEALESRLLFSGTIYTQQFELPIPADGDDDDTSVAVSGSTMVVGEFHGGAGNAGKLVVYNQSGSTWTQVAELTATDSDDYGAAVAISGNTIAVVGSAFHLSNDTSDNVVYVYQEPETGWANMTQTAELSTSSEGTLNGGLSDPNVSMSGNTIVVDGTNTSGVYCGFVFVEPSGGWANMTQTAVLSDSTQGNLLDTSISGNTIVGSSGASYGPRQLDVFTKPSSGWSDMTQTAVLSDTTYNCSGAAISGNTIVSDGSGATNPEAILVFTEPSTGWATSSQDVQLQPGDSSDELAAGGLAVDGNVIVAGDDVYIEPGSGWAAASPTTLLVPQDADNVGELGNYISISGGLIAETGILYDGIDGSSQEAVAYVFGSSSSGASQLAFTQQPSTTVVNTDIAPPITVAVEDSGGTTVATDNSSVTITATGPTGAVLSGTTIIQAVNGVATFDELSLDTPGTYYLTVSDGSLAAATSTQFTVTSTGTTSGGAAKLAFSQQPANSVEGTAITPAVTVDVEDNSGNIVTTDSSKVTLAITSGTGSGTLSGTLVEQAVNGVATFSDLSISPAGDDYTLTATDGALTSAISSAFNVGSGGTASPTTGLLPTVTLDNVPSSVIAGQAIKGGSLKFKLTNSLNTTETGTAIKLFASTSPLLDISTATLLTTLPKTPAVKAGKTGSASIALKSVPASLAAGTYYLIAETVDAAGNSPYVASSSTVVVETPVVSLSATVAAVKTATVTATKTGAVTITITNEGNITAAGPLKISLTPSTDGSSAVPGITLAMLNIRKVSLSPGKSTKYTLHFKLPAGLSDGLYFPLASVTFNGSQSTPAVGGTQFTAG